MTLAASVYANPTNARPSNTNELSYPCAIQSDWQAVCTAPETVESDSGVVISSKVVRPGNITRADQSLFYPNGRGTKLLVALKYDVGISVETSPIVRVFGRDHNGIWHVLQGPSASTEVTLTMALTTDAITTDGLYKITTPVEFELDGSEAVIVAIQTAFNGTGTKTNSEILVKLKNNR